MRIDENSYPISTVHLGMLKSDGTPVPRVESAVCAVCGAWASRICVTADATVATDSLTDVRISRVVTTVVYACAAHDEPLQIALVDEMGYASNVYEPDELAQKVSDRACATRRTTHGGA